MKHAALPGRRVARASLKPRNCRCLLELRQAKSTDGDTAACRRHEGQAEHVDYSSSSVGRLVPMSEPRYLAPDTLQGLLGRTARSCRRELQHRGTRSLVLPDSQLTCKKRPIRATETTRRVRHTATPSHLRVPRTRQRRRLQDRCPWRRPLGATIGNIQGRVLRFFGRALCTGVHGAAPVRVSVSSSPPPGNPIAHLVIHANIPIIAPCEVLRIAASGL